MKKLGNLTLKITENYLSKNSKIEGKLLLNWNKLFINYNEKFKNLLPPLTLLSEEKKKNLISKLNDLKFIIKDNLAA